MVVFIEFILYDLVMFFFCSGRLVYEVLFSGKFSIKMDIRIFVVFFLLEIYW